MQPAQFARATKRPLTPAELAKHEAQRNPGCADESEAVVGRRGRPSTLTPEIADVIVDGLTDGRSMRSLAMKLKLHLGQIYDWMDTQPNFSERVARARKLCATTHFEDTLHLSEQLAEGDAPQNNAQVRAHELRLKMLQYRAERLDPLQYGARQQVGFDDTTTKLLANLAASTASLPLSGQLIEGERVDDQKELPWDSES